MEDFLEKNKGWGGQKSTDKKPNQRRSGESVEKTPQWNFGNEDKMEIKTYKLEDLKPYENNAKIHTEEQIGQIMESIEKFGMNDPIAIWGDKNIIVEGHGRLEALKKLGFKEAPCIRLDHLTDEERRAYTLAHNKLTMNTDFDMEILATELEGIEDIDMEDFGFEIEDIGAEDPEVEEDDFEIELPEEPKSKPGDIYLLGNHRLMCGDSTKIDDVEKLLDGVKADLLITDPPYNVDYESKSDKSLKIKNDNMKDEDFYKFLYDAFVNAFTSLKDGASFYCWYASREVINFSNALKDAGLSVKQELIWNKNSLVFGRQDYQWKHEPCLYGWKETASHNFYADRTQTTVIDFDKPLKNGEHPTMKPVGLFSYQIQNSSKKGDTVLDLFGGSGTTMIACEQLDRKAYLMEFDPRYVDVIINRWEEFTGEKAELLGKEK